MISARTRLQVKNVLECTIHQILNLFIARRQIEIETTKVEDTSGRQGSMLSSTKQNNIGHFLPNKQMVFDPLQNAIAPESTPETQRAPNLVDISVLKRAPGFNSVTHRGKPQVKLDENQSLRQ